MKDTSHKKILFIITKGNLGGAQRYVYDIATNLPEEYTPKVAYGEGSGLKEALAEHHIETLQLDAIKRDISIRHELKSIRILWSLFQKEKPNIIHLNSSKAGLLGACVGRFYIVLNQIQKKPVDCKIIFTGHGWAFNEERGIVARIAIALGHYITLLLCDRVIAVSKNVAGDITRFPFVRKKIHIIYNGITPPPYKNKDEARALLSIPQDAFVFGTLSELHKNKGLDIAIRSFASIAKHFPKARFVILGSGEEKDRLEAIAHQFDITESVQFCGYVKDGATFLKAFDVFTLTSRTEAFPYAILEAGFAGLPVIASRVGGIPEIISHKRNGLLVEPKNVFDIEYSMHELVRDESQRTTLGNALKEKTANTFTLKAMIEETLRVYRN